MRRNPLCVILFVMSLVLAACGGSTTPAMTGAAPAADAAAAQGALSPVAKDMLGIFKLEDTDLAVDASQAATLLPLWQAYRSLLTSDTTALAELQAVTTQIDEGLTAEQTDAIAAMNLSAQDMIAMAEQLGVSLVVAFAGGTDSNSSRTGAVGAGVGGATGGGAPPSGDGGMPAPRSDGAGGLLAGETGAADPSMMVSSTPQASQTAARSQGDLLIQVLLDPLIELLKQRAVA